MPTRAARTSLVLGALALVAARLFGLSELFVLGTGMAIAPLISMVLVRRPLPIPDVDCTTMPRQPREGDRLRIELGIDASRRTPPYDMKQFVDGRIVAGTRVPPLTAGAHRTLTIDLEARKRGEMVIGPTRFTYVDPLTLARRIVPVDGFQSILIHPDRVPTIAPSLRNAEGRLIDALRQARGRAPTERDFRGVRGYQRGDDFRRVNWKASAKRDSLLVNEYDPDSDVVLQVIVDTHRDRHRDDTFEVAMRVAASLIDCSPDADTRVVLCVGDSVTRIDAATVGLDLLASAGTDPHPTFSTPDSPDPTAVLARIVVTGRVDADLRASLESVTPTNGAAVVIACDSVDTALPRDWMSMMCPTLGDFARRWPDFVRPSGRGF
jgi:uncharacterized protein (DUF58 family)